MRKTIFILLLTNLAFAFSQTFSGFEQMQCEVLSEHPLYDVVRDESPNSCGSHAYGYKIYLKSTGELLKSYCPSVGSASKEYIYIDTLNYLEIDANSNNRIVRMTNDGGETFRTIASGPPNGSTFVVNTETIYDFSYISNSFFLYMSTRSDIKAQEAELRHNDTIIHDTLTSPPFCENLDSITFNYGNGGESYRVVIHLHYDKNITSINTNTEKNNLLIYPNPNNEDFLKVEGNLNTEIKFIDINGITVLKKEIVNGICDIGELKKGIYILEITNQKEVTRTRFVRR